MREDWTKEIELLLRAVLFKLSVWDHDTSYGAALQGLQYTDARKDGNLGALVAPSRWQKSAHGVWNVLGKYAWQKWEDYLIDHEREVEYTLLPQKDCADSSRALRACGSCPGSQTWRQRRTRALPSCLSWSSWSMEGIGLCWIGSFG